MASETCGSTNTTSGDPCGFPAPQAKCPHHGESQLSQRKERALKLLREGYTRTEVAKQCGVARRTLYRWKDRHPDLFEEAIEEGERKQYEEVVTAWYERLKEGDHSGAEIIFFLKNRRPDLWRDRKELEHSGEVKGGDVHVYLPSNGRDDSLPEQLKRRQQAATNGS